MVLSSDSASNNTSLGRMDADTDYHFILRTAKGDTAIGLEGR